MVYVSSILTTQLTIKFKNMSNQLIAYKIYETEKNDWGNHPLFKDLNRNDKLIVGRIINNLIRQDYY